VISLEEFRSIEIGDILIQTRTGRRRPVLSVSKKNGRTQYIRLAKSRSHWRMFQRFRTVNEHDTDIRQRYSIEKRTNPKGANQ